MKHFSIKPLPAAWNGRTFRSRTEARWAAFLDTIGIAYHYETCGFDIGGVRYLPDFYFPQVRMWAEVKPYEPDEQEIDKCKRLAIATDLPVLMLDGLPEYRAYKAYEVTETAPGVSEVVEVAYSLDLGDGKNRYYYDKERRLFCCPYEPDLAEDRCSEWYRHAIRTSRSTKFGFGDPCFPNHDVPKFRM